MQQDTEKPGSAAHTPGLLTFVPEITIELQRRLMGRPAAKFGSCFRPRLPRVQCADGFNVSVQTGYGNYCHPRDNEGPWSSVELGFPSHPMPTLAEYCESDEAAAPTITDTVWGYVPLEKVAAVIAAHGGLLPEDATATGGAA